MRYVAMGLLLCACNGPTDQSLLKYSEVPGSHNDHAELAQSYSTLKSKVLPTVCVRGTQDESAGNSSAKFTIVEDIGTEDLSNSIGGQLSANANFPVIRAGVDANLIKDLAASEYVANRHVTYSLSPKKKVLRPPFQVSPDLKERIASGTFDASLCGDEFVTAIHYGAHLFVNMRIEFLNANDKLEIGGKINVATGIDGAPAGVNIDAEADYLDEKVKKSVKITVHAEQQGGDPKQFAAVIPQEIMTCTLDQPEPCIKLFENVINYAKEGFSTQLENLDTYNVIKYETESFEDVGIYELSNSAVTLEAAQFSRLKKDIDSLFQKSIEDEKRANTIINSYRSWVDDDQYEKIKEIERSASKNSDLLLDTAKFCYDSGNYDECSTFYDDTRANLLEYERELLSIVREDQLTLQQCENARMIAVELGLVKALDAKAFENRGEAPIFVSNENPASGVESWVKCYEAAKSYDGSFKQLD